MSATTLRRVGAGLAAILAAAALTVACAPGTPAQQVRPIGDDAVVRTDEGGLRGSADAGHAAFRGVPYARPPVGELRWRAPLPPQPWEGTRDAVRPGPMCPQSYTYPPGSPPKFAGDEDCLTLDVHVPRTAEGPLPVMVFLHGGGFAVGGGASYDPRRVSGQGVIVVTPNYRLGALGFLAHPDLADPWAGNLGIADQQMALRWVERNIAAFGGDPGNVTLWGESAGAFGVCAHLATPSGRGLFDKAITQSGPCANGFVPQEQARQRGRRAAADLGCDPATGPAAAQCLRGLPAAQVAALYADRPDPTRFIAELPWMPVAGTPVLPGQPLDAVRDGSGNTVPMLAGGTSEEMRRVVLARLADGLGPVTPQQYPRLVEQLYGRDAAAVLAQYPLAGHESPGAALSAVLTDEGRAVGACRQLVFDDALSVRAPVYAFEFAEPDGKVTDGFAHGALHGADVPYFFDSYARPPAPRPEAQARLAGTLIGHWTAFARTGDPGGGWEPYAPGRVRSFAAAGIGPVDAGAAHRCGFWNGR